MNSRLFARTLALLTLTLAGAAHAQASRLTPAQMATNLQELQARIAQGDTAAQAAQPAMLRDMAAAFSDAKPDIWASEDNQYAAVAYLLSGGSPRVIARLIEGDAPSANVALIHGALAYVLGRQDEAEKLLDGLDPKALDLRLAGQIAFVQSVLITSKDNIKAMQLLDLARLLAPGGLVEEASLRREILLAGDMRDIDRFTSLSREYLSRFPHSLYAPNFMRSFASIVARLGLANDIADLHKFDVLAAALAPGDRGELYLAIARAALLNGKIDVAELASKLALQQMPPDSPDQARGRLYQAAARTMTAQYDAGIAEMETIDAKMLNRRDQALLVAARDLATRLHKVPQPRPTPGPAALKPSPAPPIADDAATATIHLAEATISRADLLLTGKTP